MYPSRMGLTAGPLYTTAEGFEISPLYLSVSGFRFLQIQGSSQYHSVVYVEGFKSREDKYAGRKAIVLPANLANAEGFVSMMDFIRKGAFGVFYDIVRSAWVTSGYVVEDIVEMGQCKPSDYVYDCSGFTVDGFNSSGFNESGFDKDGFNENGIDRDGYTREGYDSEGYNRQGYNHQGYNRLGFTIVGYDSEGYTIDGYNTEGFNRAGFDRDGYNRFGLDINGNPRPILSMDASGSQVS